MSRHPLILKEKLIEAGIDARDVNNWTDFGQGGYGTEPSEVLRITFYQMGLVDLTINTAGDWTGAGVEVLIRGSHPLRFFEGNDLDWQPLADKILRNRSIPVGILVVLRNCFKVVSSNW